MSNESSERYNSIDHREALALMNEKPKIFNIDNYKEMLAKIAEWESRYERWEKRSGHLVVGEGNKFHRMMERTIEEIKAVKEGAVLMSEAALIAESDDILNAPDPRQILKEIIFCEKRFTDWETRSGHLMGERARKKLHDQMKVYLNKMHDKEGLIFGKTLKKYNDQLYYIAELELEIFQGPVVEDALKKLKDNGEYLCRLCRDFQGADAGEFMESQVKEAVSKMEDRLMESKSRYPERPKNIQVAQIKYVEAPVAMKNAGTPHDMRDIQQTRDDMGNVGGMHLHRRKKDFDVESLPIPLRPPKQSERSSPELKIREDNEKLKQSAALFLGEIDEGLKELPESGESSAAVGALKNEYEKIKKKFDRICSGEEKELSGAKSKLLGNKDYTLPKWTSTVEVKVANEVKFKLNNLIRKIKNLKSDLENIQAQAKVADSSPQTDNKSSQG